MIWGVYTQILHLGVERTTTFILSHPLLTVIYVLTEIMETMVAHHAALLCNVNVCGAKKL